MLLNRINDLMNIVLLRYYLLLLFMLETFFLIIGTKKKTKMTKFMHYEAKERKSKRIESIQQENTNKVI